MQDIPTRFMGYQKDVVNELIKEKDTRLKTQQEDINYLRKEVTKLEKKIKKNSPKN